jgi:hypothetical protein
MEQDAWVLFIAMEKDKPMFVSNPWVVDQIGTVT